MFQDVFFFFLKSLKDQDYWAWSLDHPSCVFNIFLFLSQLPNLLSLNLSFFLKVIGKLSALSKYKALGWEVSHKRVNPFDMFAGGGNITTLSWMCV